jgi:hypothetical protein
LKGTEIIAVRQPKLREYLRGSAKARLSTILLKADVPISYSSQGLRRKSSVGSKNSSSLAFGGTILPACSARSSFARSSLAILLS